MKEFIIVILTIIVLLIILFIIDYISGKDCPKCGCRMLKRFNYDILTEEYKCPQCQYVEYDT